MREGVCSFYFRWYPNFCAELCNTETYETDNEAGSASRGTLSCLH